MRKLMLWSTLTVVVLLAAVAGLYWTYWSLYARFEPRVVVGDVAAVQALLDESGWVSDGGGGAPLYLVGWRDCESCARYQLDEFPMLRAAGVEPRVVLIARPDQDGLPRSTASERSTVAELWTTRDWTLFQRWTATPARNWTAAGIPPADGNAARTALIEQGRDFQARLEQALRASGVRDIRYPLILWRDPQGVLKVCACSDARGWAFIRDDLGADVRPSDPAPLPPADPVQVEVAPIPYPDVAGDRPEPVSPPPAEDVRPNAVPRGETRPPASRPAARPQTRPEARPETRQPTPPPSEPARRPTPRQPETRRPEPQPDTRRPPTRPQRPTSPQPLPREEEDDTMFY